MRKFNTINHKEINAASITIMEAYDGHSELSGYLGSEPHGGPMCRALECLWEVTFGIKHAVAVNSATSGLLAACMAIGIKPGDEVIVSPYTMSATAAVPKILGAKIVFADIEDETFGLDPLEVGNLISNPKTKAVIVTNLFGHPARLKELKSLCDNHGVYLIEDNAQSIFAKEGTKYAGTIGHIGVFSLNVHKQIQVGEGGIAVTNDGVLARNLREAMNHGEMRGGILGLNLRMTEVTAAMAIEQVKKAERVISEIREFAETVTHFIKRSSLPIVPSIVRKGCVHSYYCWTGIITHDKNLSVGPPFRRGYMRPLYDLKAFSPHDQLETVERVQKNLILLEMCAIPDANVGIDDMVRSLWSGK